MICCRLTLSTAMLALALFSPQVNALDASFDQGKDVIDVGGVKYELNDAIQSNFGQIQTAFIVVDGGGRVGTPVLFLNKIPVFSMDADDADQRVEPLELFHLGVEDVLIFDTACACSDSSPPFYRLLVLRKGSKPTVEDVGSSGVAGGAYRQEGSKLFLELGVIEGNKVTAEYSGGKLVLHSKSAAGLPLDAETCKWLYKQVLSGECISLKDTFKSCEMDPDSGEAKFSLASMGGFGRLRQDPGFNAVGFFDACTQACEKGTPLPYREFASKACGLK
jgi:hypothetical protein